MKKVFMVLIIAAFAFGAQGCYKHTFNVGQGAPNGKQVYNSWHAHWLFGIIGDKELDIDQICPSGNATIHNEISFVNGLVGALIGVVHYPTTVWIKCEQTTSALELSVDQAITLATHPDFLHYVGEVAPDLMEKAEKAAANARVYRQANL